MVLKWGIISAGKICSNFVQAILITPRTEHEVVAIAARDEDRSKKFAETYGIPNYYGDYISLAKDKDVDVVYIGNINPYHMEVSKLMLEHGKHVLCEKPLTMNEKQSRELIEFAKKKRLFLMEAIWSRCFPAYGKLRELLDSDAIGEVLYVSVTMGRKLNQVERINLKELGGGIILDLGVYALQFSQIIFAGLKIVKIVSSGHLNKWGTDESASMIITYEGGKTAVLSIHACIELPNEGIIVGTKGTIRVPTFWRPTTLITPNGTLDFELPNKENDNYRIGGLSYEVEEVGRCIKEGLLESPKITHEQSLQLAQLMDKFRQGAGVAYEEDL